MNKNGESYLVRKFISRAIAAGTFAFGLSTSSIAQMSFEGLGDLPGGTNLSSAQAISADGTTVVGGSDTDNGVKAFRWQQSTAMSGLGSLMGASGESMAYGVSADGSVVVGESASTGFDRRAFRWSNSSGMTGLDDLDGGPSNCVAYAVSADGSVIVGTGRSGPRDSAVRWSGGTTPAAIHIHDGAFYSSAALAVSGDGVVAAGNGFSPTTPAYQAFLWLSGDGMDLGVLPGAYSYSSAYGISDAGDVAVGWGLDSDWSIRPFRWTVDEGMAAIPGLPGEYQGFAWAVSADGSVVVGTNYTDAGQFAFLWSEESGTIAIHDLLSSNGVDVSGWTLIEAVGVSSDGTCIAGNGINPSGDLEAWLVRIVVNLDSDGDGVNDDLDAFPNSVMSATLVVDGNVTSVPNLVFPDGSTMADQIMMVGSQSGTHGGFSTEVSHLTNSWVQSGLITSKQKGVIQKAVAGAKIP